MENYKNTKVLLLNDSPIQLETFKALLKSLGCEVFAFLDPTEGLEHALKNPVCDAVVTDLYMPKIDGWRVCNLLRSADFSTYNNVPILVTSATFSGAEAESITSDLGANGFVSVPVTKDEFLKAFAQVTSGQKHTNLKKVLIVEDDPVQSRILDKTFSEGSFSVSKSTTTEEMKRALLDEDYNLVILDYHLPDGEGHENIQLIKEAVPQAVIFVITADNCPERALELIHMGAYSYLVKPFSPKYLLELCETALRQKSLLLVEDLLEERTKEVLRSEQNYKSLVENISTGIFETDSDGRINFVSSRWENLTGISKNKSINKNWIDLLPDADQINAKEFWRSTRHDSSISKLTWEQSSQFGKEKWFEISFSKKFKTENEQSTDTFVGLLEDVSERKLIEKQKEKDKWRTFQSHKTVSIAQMATGVAHEINNPLTVALTRSHKILKDWDEMLQKPSDLREQVEKIEQSCSRIMNVISTLRALTTNDEDEPSKTINMKDVICATADIYKSKLAQNGIELELSLPKNLELNAKNGELSQIFVNLIENIIQFKDPNEKNNIATIKAQKNEGNIEVIVSDNGIGISEELKNRIFEPYFTTSEDLKQLAPGLGLSIAASIIERYNGRIEISKTSKPTEFLIQLPAI